MDSICWSFTTCVSAAVLLLMVLPTNPAQAQLEPGAQTQGVTWRPMNEPGCGGAMTALAVSPHDSNLVLVAGDMLGVGLSTDRGQSWQSTFGFASWEIADFSFHPTDPKVIWVGTMSGPYTSSDGGRTWVQKREGMPAINGGMYSAPIEKVLFDPNDQQRLLAFGGSSRRWHSPGTPAWGAVWESHDGGERWTRLSTLTQTGSSTAPAASGINIVAAAFAPGSSSDLYALVDGQGFYASNDGGKSWQKRNAGLPHTVANRLAVHPTDPQTIWISLGAFRPKDAKTCLPGGIFKTTDGGRNWQPANQGLSQHTGDNEMLTANYTGLAVAASDPRTLYACDGAWNGATLYRSRNGGQSWQPAVGDRHSRPPLAYFAGTCMGYIAIDPRDANAIYACNSEYILRSLDGGNTWNDATSFQPDPANKNLWCGRGYSGLCSVNFLFDPHDTNRSFLMAMDAGKLWESRNGLRSWQHHGKQPSPWGGGSDVTVAGERGKYVYATFGQFGSFDGIARTTDGVNWSVLQGPEHGLPTFGDRKEPCGIYALPDEPTKVWAVIGGDLYASSDAGEHWTALLTGQKLQWIAADPTQPTRFYVSGAKGIYQTEDGKTFRSIGGPRPAGRGKLRADAQGRLYACQWRDGRPGLWRYTREAGGMWVRLRDDAYICDVAIDPTDTNRIAVATHDHPYHDHCFATGVWISADAGQSWSQANEGLVILRGECVVFNPHDPEQLVFGSHGRGFFVGRWPRSFVPRGTQTYSSDADDAKAAAIDPTADVAPGR